MKGDKLVAFCERKCNVIAPFVAAPGNQNESPLLREGLPQVMRIARAVGFSLRGAIVSLDGAYDCRLNRKAIFNRGMTPISTPTRAAESNPSADASRSSIPTFLKSGSTQSSGCSPGKTSSGACCFGSSASANCTTPLKPWPIR
ncbi:hypothetical protein ACFOFO_16045 [Undibacterium arcticum]|uniref:Transposase DDE domain-containing protein n=1 Tax=Undibacterium arcticum TaxID=1762892 RepID=A0ABV7F5I9_9BURK